MICNTCIHQKACIGVFAHLGRLTTDYSIVSCEHYIDKDDLADTVITVGNWVYEHALNEDWKKIEPTVDKLETMVLEQ